MKIVRHRLHLHDNDPCEYRKSPCHGGKMTPRLLVIHFTAGASAESSINWFLNPQAKASAHLVIDRNGHITQMVPFDTVAWHAGASRWNDLSGLNHHSIGIELDNAGRLQPHGDQWRSWFGRDYHDDEVLVARHKHETEPSGWQLYTREQIETTLEVAQCLFARYGLEDIVGHEDIAPGRKSDPGPAFPMGALRARLLGRQEDSLPVMRTTTGLNIRSGPGVRHPLLPSGPLPQGVKLEVIDQDGDWRRVSVLEAVNGLSDLEGWVHGRYLEPVEA
ncbi:N-acetylmuramyl-L-alanine amidase, negative regulator of AmpC, AmpD [Thioalkalivibrio sulfidiphilus HL-EbGr7]|uniref:N-acetylmuramoyl-L-alanine amidase n=1 Tax=Thioalkalivibrio sulfidiphilus (strain HL-EbGR7) TaxID=396588 RepID=B8GT21_THISH|nr:N-acetylmuramoyl-L-alanine amidase [Thioalkalivibrio sulfidiphilus]ACL73036.1 N-acetylmuramyl-L-alanine amidase, negative regulator of AmpC, AmpD [Thioalkalivibrio sulfidiphilus HL-EbGr7]